MEPIMAKVGTRDVVSSGVIVATPDDPIEIQLMELSFLLQFVSADPSGSGKASVRGEGKGNHLTLYLTNFNTGFGVSYHTEVGTYRSRELFLSLFVQAVRSDDGDVTYSVAYTLSLGARR